MVGLKELLDSIQLIRLELNTPFRGVNTREIALIEGPYGWGSSLHLLNMARKNPHVG